MNSKSHGWGSPGFSGFLGSWRLGHKCGSLATTKRRRRKGDPESAARDGHCYAKALSQAFRTAADTSDAERRHDHLAHHGDRQVRGNKQAEPLQGPESFQGNAV